MMKYLKKKSENNHFGQTKRTKQRSSIVSPFPPTVGRVGGGGL